MNSAPMNGAPMAEVNFLWIGGPLSLVEQLALVSFRDHGHHVRLYTYDGDYDIPGVQVLDAREILPRDRVFTYGDIAKKGKGSPAAFANLFRYKLLLERGGYWVDTDVVALAPLPAADTFLAWTDTTPTSTINNAVVALPAGSALARQLYEISESVPPELQRWGECGPQLMTSLVAMNELEHLVSPSSTVHPISFPDALDSFRPDPFGRIRRRTRGSLAVHLWNEILRQNALDKNGPFPRSSLFATLARRHGLL
jgi:hypothetical protein